MEPRRSYRRLFRLPLSAGTQAERDLDEEIRLHLDLRTEELMSQGMSESEARREAERAFGDAMRARRALIGPDRRHQRRVRVTEWLGDVARDVRHAARSLARSPAFTAVAALTLALGIGANTALFSVVDTVLLEPLPFESPDELVMIFEAHADRGPDDRNVVNPANYMDWRERSRSFESMGALSNVPVTVMIGGEPREVVSQLVHPDLFAALGTKPLLGRVFTLEESAPTTPQVVILSEQFWREQFGGDRSVIGRTLEIVGATPQVIGVMPAEVGVATGDVAFWWPTDWAYANRQTMGRYIRVLGRLNDGVTAEMADRELGVIAADLAREHPNFNTDWSVNVVPLREHLHGDVRVAMLVVLGAVGVLLLIASVNVANLLLVRAATRRTEVAVRAALGAGPGRIARGLLVESLLLAGAGGALGVGIAFLATRALVAGVPESLRIPRLDAVDVDGSVLLFAAGAAVLTGLLFGLVPVAQAFRADLLGGLRESARTGGSRSARRTRSALVVAEIALSLVLLAGAGLLLRSFVALRSTDTGFDTENVLTGRVTLRGQRYADGTARTAFFDQAISRIAAEPGVEAVGMIWWLPLSGLISRTGYYLPENPLPTPQQPITQVQSVQGDLFRALGIPLLRGRSFDSRDNANGARVAIVNAAFAERAWPGEDPIGRRVVLPWDEDRVLQVVGVVGDIRQSAVNEPAEPTIYMPHAQFTQFASANLIVRTNGRSTAMRAIADHVHDIDPQLAIADAMPMHDVFADAVARPRLTSLLVTLFAMLALVLAAVGIYGVVAYTVTLRQRELGVRRALGAQTTHVARMVVADALRLGGTGVVIGIVVALVATRVLESLLYDVRPGDPLVLGLTAATLLVVTIVAALVPALRAARVSPTAAIRYG